jgi:hypothetical protein
MRYAPGRPVLLLVVALAAGVFALSSGERVQGQEAAVASPVGVNLAFFKDWSTEIPLVDVFQSSREWIPSERWSDVWDSGVAVPLDANGWPLEIPYDDGVNPPQVVKTRMLHAQMTPYPTGTYTLIFEGDGTIEIDLDANGVFEGGGTHTFEVTTPTDEGLLLSIVRSDAADPVRGVHVILPGRANTWESQPFNPNFLSAMEPFSVLRFMDWAEVTASPLVEWADRPLLTDARQSSERGMAYEWMIRASNELDADPWLSMPHMASDDYIREAARLWRDELEPGRQLYLEYSNEPWNPDHATYPQGAWMQEQGLALGLSTDPVIAGSRYQAKRSVETFAIFEEEWGADADRLVTVLSGFLPLLDVTEEIISSAQQASINGVPVNTSGVEVDAVAFGMYIGWEVADAIVANGELNTIEVDEIIGRLRAELVDEVGPAAVAERALADEYGLQMLAYEGGQYLVPNGVNVENEQLRQLLVAANRDEGMYTLYRELLDTWASASGGGLFNHYRSIWKPDGWGHLGLLEYPSQPRSEAPKYRAISDYVTESTPLPTGAPVPATTITLSPGFNLVAWSGGATNSDALLQAYPGITIVWLQQNGQWTVDGLAFPSFVRQMFAVEPGTIMLIVADETTVIPGAS